MARMAQHPGNQSVIDALNARMRETTAPRERFAVLEDLVRCVYDSVKHVYTGDGLDGYDSEERAVVGQVLDHLLGLGEQMRMLPPDRQDARD